MDTDRYLHAERAETLRETAAAAPDEVDPVDLAAVLIRGTPEARRVGGAAYDELTGARPGAADAVAAELDDVLVGDDADLQRRSAAAVASLAGRHPDAYRRTVRSLTDVVADGGDAGRDRALAALHELATYHPDAVRTAVPILLDVLAESEPGASDRGADPGLAHPDDPGPGPAVRGGTGDSARVAAAETLAAVASEHPDAVADDVDRVGPLLSDPTADVRAAGCDVVAAVARDRPAAVHHLVDDLADLLLTDAEFPVPWKAAGALAVLAGDYPQDLADAVSGDVGAMTDLLADADVDVRRVGVVILSYVAEHRPAAVGPACSALQERLDDENPAVRATAARALGDAGDVESLDALSDRAANDPDPDVREFAAAAADRVRRRADAGDVDGPDGEGA